MQASSRRTWLAVELAEVIGFAVRLGAEYEYYSTCLGTFDGVLVALLPVF